MQKIKSTQEKKIKKALKTLKFWYKVLKQTNLMDESEFRNEYANALKTIKKQIPKKQKRI